MDTPAAETMLCIRPEHSRTARRTGAPGQRPVGRRACPRRRRNSAADGLHHLAGAAASRAQRIASGVPTRGPGSPPCGPSRRHARTGAYVGRAPDLSAGYGMTVDVASIVARTRSCNARNSGSRRRVGRSSSPAANGTGSSRSTRPGPAAQHDDARREQRGLLDAVGDEQHGLAGRAPDAGAARSAGAHG